MSRPKELEIAEKYLKEMLKADDAADFDLFTKRYESKYLENFTKERFQNDIEEMHKRNGMNKGYEFLASFRNEKIDGNDVYRTIWKGVYEKRDAVIDIGVYKSQETWHVLISAVH
ncbi:MAG: hypothetical protein ACRBCI_07290 [Cellvibrionaceae bacterium]